MGNVSSDALECHPLSIETAAHVHRRPYTCCCILRIGQLASASAANQANFNRTASATDVAMETDAQAV
eukprot:4290739-Pleurochrysis_carterae.AAC.1